MTSKGNSKIRRRGFNMSLLLASTAILCAPATGVLAQNQPTVRLAISQSPWLDSFSSVVKEYEKETGNKIEMSVVPFGGLLEKIRNSVRASSGTFDLVNVNSLWLPEIYSGGYLVPLDKIQKGYKLQDNVLTYGSTVFWDAKDKTFDANGELMGVPLNGNVQVLYYNTDVYKKLGLKPPKNWDQLIANSQAIKKAGSGYAFVPRSERSSIVYNFTPYLFSYGASYFNVGKGAEVTVEINSPNAKQAFDTYLDLAQKYGPPNPGSIGQGDLIQLLATGRGVQAIAVIAAWGDFENPDKSAVVGKISAALIPSGPDGKSASAAGHWVAGIPKNAPADHQKAALAFLDWFQKKKVQIDYVKAGGVPVRGDIGESDVDNKKSFRFLDAYSANAKNAVMDLPVPEAAEISDAVALDLNKAVIKEISDKQALNNAAQSIAKIMKRDGFKVKLLPDLR